MKIIKRGTPKPRPVVTYRGECDHFGTIFEVDSTELEAALSKQDLVTLRENERVGVSQWWKMRCPVCEPPGPFVNLEVSGE